MSKKKHYWVILQCNKQKPGHTTLFVTEDPEHHLQQNSVWDTQTIIYSGNNKEAGEALINLASQDAGGRQIRGLVSRGPKLDVLATKYRLPQFSRGFDAEKRSYSLEDFICGTNK